jgi:hypothetical protein
MVLLECNCCKDIFLNLIKTELYNENISDEIKVLCPRTNIFFIFLAGILHKNPNYIIHNIFHVLYHIQTKKLIICWYGKTKFEIDIGLKKAWNLFWQTENLDIITYEYIDNIIHKTKVNNYYINNSDYIDETTLVGLLCNNYNKDYCDEEDDLFLELNDLNYNYKKKRKLC